MPAYQTPPWPGAPPAPLVNLRISWINRPSEQVLAILDSGADQTQIPVRIALSLSLRKLRDKVIADANGKQQWQPVYAANIEFDGIMFDNIPVVGGPLSAIALIGRDLLNQVAVLDGPQLTFSLIPVQPTAP